MYKCLQRKVCTQCCCTFSTCGPEEEWWFHAPFSQQTHNFEIWRHHQIINLHDGGLAGDRQLHWSAIFSSTPCIVKMLNSIFSFWSSLSLTMCLVRGLVSWGGNRHCLCLVSSRGRHVSPFVWLGLGGEGWYVHWRCNIPLLRTSRFRIYWRVHETPMDVVMVISEWQGRISIGRLVVIFFQQTVCYFFLKCYVLVERGHQMEGRFDSSMTETTDIIGKDDRGDFGDDNNIISLAAVS